MQDTSGFTPLFVDTNPSNSPTALTRSEAQRVRPGSATVPHRTTMNNDPRNRPNIKKRSSTIGPGSGNNFSSKKSPSKQELWRRSSKLTTAASSRRVRSGGASPQKQRRRSRRMSDSLQVVDEAESGRLNHFRDAFINRQRQRSSGGAGGGHARGRSWGSTAEGISGGTGKNALI